MGSQGSKDWSKHRDEFIKQMNLAMCRVKLIEKKYKNDLIMMYHNVEEEIKNGNDPSIKVEQSIYQEHNIEVLNILIRNIDTLTTRKHLLDTNSIHELMSTIHTLVYSLNKLNLEELGPISKILIDIYGKKYYQEILENKHSLVDKQLLEHVYLEIPSQDDLVRQKDRVVAMYKGSPGCAKNLGEASVKKTVHTGNREFDEILSRVERLRTE